MNEECLYFCSDFASNSGRGSVGENQKEGGQERGLVSPLCSIRTKSGQQNTLRANGPGICLAQPNRAGYPNAQMHKRANGPAICSGSSIPNVSFVNLETVHLPFLCFFVFFDTPRSSRQLCLACTAIYGRFRRRR